jgi:hypothetical protein
LLAFLFFTLFVGWNCSPDRPNLIHSILQNYIYTM